jgi:hypothetical protein
MNQALRPIRIRDGIHLILPQGEREGERKRGEREGERKRGEREEEGGRREEGGREIIEFTDFETEERS